jgi:hypothetical protein
MSNCNTTSTLSQWMENCSTCVTLDFTLFWSLSSKKIHWILGSHIYNLLNTSYLGTWRGH